MQQTDDWSKTRIEMSVVGIAGGAACWWLFDVLPDLLSNDRLGLLISMSVLGVFLVTMAMMGPVRLGRAVLGGLGLSLGIALLTFWASFRFDSASAFFEGGHPAAAVLVLYLVGFPFLLVMLEHGRGAWKDYAALFQTAWTIIVRFLAAGLFTAIVWGVLFLSNALLELVHISVIEDVLDVDPVPFVISGGVFGLALAVAFEWRDYISPHLLLRLLRLLVPMVMPVLALFLLAVLSNGLENVVQFGSQTGLLTAVAIGGITLVTVSVDRDAAHQVRARVLRWSVRILAVLLLPLAGLAVWGIGVRVAEYGWTPERLLAALSVGMVVLYGGSYAVLVLFPGNWAARLRGVNIALALLSVGLAVLWLTPVLNAERIAARSQVARILSGQVRPDQAALWEFAHKWGDAGQQALADLRARPDYPNRAEILAWAAKAEQSDTRYQYSKRAPDPAGPEPAVQLARLVPLRPQGATLPPGAFSALPKWRVSRAIEACQRVFDDGRPGCVYLQMAFLPHLSEPQGVLLLRETDTRVRGYIYVLRDGRLERDALLADWTTGIGATLPADTIQKVLEGAFQTEPAQVNVLKIGERALFPDN